MLFEDLIKYILSLKNCNTICKKKNRNYKKKKNLCGTHFTQSGM